MIDDKPVIVTDPKKIKEIKEALKSSNIHCINIKPATPSPLPENAADMWFGKINNYARVVKSADTQDLKS